MLTARRGIGATRTGTPTAASTNSHDQPLDFDHAASISGKLFVAPGANHCLIGFFNPATLDGYGFSIRFGWVGDRHGVTWQLNLR